MEIEKIKEIASDIVDAVAKLVKETVNSLLDKEPEKKTDKKKG